MNKKNFRLGIIAAIASCFFFRTDLVFGKKLLESFSPETVAFVTLFIAGIVTLIDLEQRQELKALIKIETRAKWHILLISIISAVIIPILFFMGLKYTSAINVSLFINTKTIILIIFGILFLREKITAYAVLGLVFMFSGVGVIATNGFHEKITFAKGDLIIFALALAIAASTLIFKKYSTYKKPHLLVSARALIGSIILGPIVLLTKQEEILNTNLLIQNLPLFIGYAFFVVLIGYLLEFWAIKQIPISLFSMLALIAPIVGIFYAVIFLNEHLFLAQAIGGILILFGLFVAKLHKNQTKRDHHPLAHQRHIQHD